MEMTNEEILVRFRQAKNRREQITILADLNACSCEDIARVLLESKEYSKAQIAALTRRPRQQKPKVALQSASVIPDGYTRYTPPETQEQAIEIPDSVQVVLQAAIDELRTRYDQSLEFCRAYDSAKAWLEEVKNEDESCKNNGLVRRCSPARKAGEPCGGMP